LRRRSILKRCSVTGPAVTLFKGVWISSWSGYADFAFSDTGTLVYVSGGPNPTKASLVSVDRAGRSSPLIDQPRARCRPHGCRPMDCMSRSPSSISVDI
jgi:hypothetical protein